MQALHTIYVSILQAKKLRDSQNPSLFTGYRLSQQLRQYPFHQMIGLLPRTLDQGTLLLHTPPKQEWPWEQPFLADLLRWLRALTWTMEPGTVTFLELALDFEESAQGTLPQAPQAKYKGVTPSLQERGRVLRLALATTQHLVTRGLLHQAHIITRCNSLIPLGGPAICRLSQRPYFACRAAMLPQIRKLAEYCEHTWTHKIGVHRTHNASISIPTAQNRVKSGGRQITKGFTREPAGRDRAGFRASDASQRVGGAVPPSGQTYTP